MLARVHLDKDESDRSALAGIIKAAVGLVTGITRDGDPLDAGKNELLGGDEGFRNNAYHNPESSDEFTAGRSLHNNMPCCIPEKISK